MAYYFNDATSEALSYGDVTIFDGLTTYSAHSWVNVRVTDNDNTLLTKGDTNRRFLLWNDDVGGVSGRTNIYASFLVTLSPSANSRVEGAQDSCTPGTWQPVGFSADYGSSTGHRLYIDGTEDANSPGDPSALGSVENTATDLYVGAGTSGFATSSNGGTMDGDMAEVAFWSAVLTAAEFAALGAGVSAAKIRPNSLIFYAPLIREKGDLVGGIAPTVNSTPDVVAHPRVFMPLAQILQFPPASAAGTLPGFHAMNRGIMRGVARGVG